ncbi:MAG: uroporphyrinogen-III synthase [Hyphomicrobiales bacterium]
MKTLLVTRSRPGADEQAAKLRALGFGGLVEPLLHIEYVSAPEISLDGAQGLVVTSANALRAVELLPADAVPRSLPLYAVGDATAGHARRLGFTSVVAGPGDGEGLAALIVDGVKPGAGALLHLCGERLAFDMAAALGARGYEMRGTVVYRAHDAGALSRRAREHIATGRLAGALLMSPATAAVYAGVVARAGLSDAARSMQYFCLSRNVADRIAGLGLRHVNVAATPKEDDLLALVSDRLAN